MTPDPPDAPAESAPPTDAELCKAVRDGRAALDALIDRHKGMVYRIVADMRLPPQVDRDDLIQFGLMALTRATEKWIDDGRSKFPTYAWTAVENAVCREAGRESERFASLNVPCTDADGSELMDLVPAPEPAEVPVSLREGVERLPPVLRTIVTMHYGLDGTPAAWSEIAEAVGLSIHQAKRALELALRQL